MPSYKESFSGKAMYCFHNKLDQFDAYSIKLYLDDKSLAKVQALINGRPAILNRLGKDDQGYFMKFKVLPEKKINGITKTFSVKAYKADGETPFDGPIGHGSDVTISCEVYTYRKGEGKAVRWEAIRVDNLVPFDSASMFDVKDPNSMEEVPKPVWG